jgi:hypothetical protein
MSHSLYSERRVRMSTHCHVCHDKFTDNDVVVEHSGTIASLESILPETEKAEHGSIALHQECATILAMRLLHDVMDIRHVPDGMRVVDTLRNVREAYQMK